MADWNEVLYGNTETMRPDTGLSVADYSAVTQPQTITPSPPKSPEDFTRRVDGWRGILDRVNNDPNLRRALMFASASMLGPQQWGDTAGGRIAQGALAGMTAYDMGNEAQTQQQRQAETHALQSAAAQQQLETSALALRKQRETIDDAIEKVKLENEKARLDLTVAKDKEEADAIVRANTIRKQKILADIPDSALRKAAENELAASAADLELKKAHADYYRAASRAAMQRGTAHESQLTAKQPQLTAKQAMDLELANETAPTIVAAWDKVAKEFGQPVETVTASFGQLEKYLKAKALVAAKPTPAPAPAPEKVIDKEDILTTDQLRRSASGKIQYAK